MMSATSQKGIYPPLDCMRAGSHNILGNSQVDHLVAKLESDLVHEELSPKGVYPMQ